MRSLPRSAGDLLRQVEPLAHPERCRRLAAAGRQLAGQPALAEILATLGSGGQYERSAALLVAGAARDLNHAAGTLGDADPAVACAAVRLAVRLGVSAEILAAALTDAPAVVRAAVYTAVRRCRRTDLAEELIDVAPAHESAALLVACGQSVVRERIDDLAYAVPNWSSLGRRHPGPVLEHAERLLAILPPHLRDQWWARCGGGVAAAVPDEPERVIALLEAHWARGPLHSAFHPRLGLLMDADSERVLRLLSRPEHRDQLGRLLYRGAVQRRLARLTDEDLAAIGRLVREDPYAWLALLRAVPPGRRSRLFDAVLAGMDWTQAYLWPALMDVLPRATRTEEARRMLGMRHIADDPERTLEVLSYLPFREVADRLLAATKRSDAEERGEGYRRLLACAGRDRDPSTIARVLAGLDRLANEQDPVRLQAMDALAAIPPAAFDPTHLPLIGRLVDDALAARDCSYGTRYALTQLATRIFEQGALREEHAMLRFALDGFEKLTGHMGSIYLGQLRHVLRRGQEHDLVRMLAPYMAAEARRDQFRLVLAIAAALGRRGRGVPTLQDALERAVHARDDNVIRLAVDRWLAAPRTRADRVAKVIAMDASTITIGAVIEAIAGGRTDLLDIVLGGRAPTGRFLKRGVRHVPDIVPRWVRRWTPRQRSAYLGLLHRLAGDSSLPEFQRADAVRKIGSLPGVSAGELARYLESGNDYLRRSALTAYAWTARPGEVLGPLLAGASGADAHVAVYAATRAARFVPPSTLSSALAPVLADGKVTARKEAIRLLAVHHAPSAVETFAARWDDEHRDVRAAIASAARLLVDEPTAWRLLSQAADGDAELARQVLHGDPLAVAARWRQPYGELILRAAKSDDVRTTGPAIGMLAQWAPWTPGAAEHLATVVADRSTTTNWRVATTALITCACSGIGLDELRAIVVRLALAEPAPDAEADRDRPAERRLRTLVDDLVEAGLRDRTSADPVIRMIDELVHPHLGAVLLASTLDWDAPDVAAVLDGLAARPVGGALAMTDVGRAFRPALAYADLDEVCGHAERLGGRGDEGGGLLACALAGECGQRAGWTPRWRSLLRGLRVHDSAEVVYAATRVHTAPE